MTHTGCCLIPGRRENARLPLNLPVIAVTASLSLAFPLVQAWVATVPSTALPGDVTYRSCHVAADAWLDVVA